MKTLPLDKKTWDVILAPNGNWEAIDDEALFTSQTAANECLQFTDDAYFFPADGVPYFQDILGRNPPRSLAVEHLKKRILGVPLVVKTEIIDYYFADRTIHGSAIIWTENGGKYNVSF